MKKITRSKIDPQTIIKEGEVNDNWLIETKGNTDPHIGHPAGLLISYPAPKEEDISETFTAKNGKLYYDTTENSKFKPFT